MNLGTSERPGWPGRSLSVLVSLQVRSPEVSEVSEVLLLSTGVFLKACGLSYLWFVLLLMSSLILIL
jgi:hypothetical protein